MAATDPLSSELRSILLVETREQYKSERERSVQVSARSGVYLAAIGVILTALYRLLDKPPSGPCPAFTIAVIVTLLATGIAVIYVFAALFGWTTAQGPSPKIWLAHAKAATERVGAKTPPGEAVQAATFVAGSLEQQLIERLVEAVEVNLNTNQKRYRFLLHAARGTAVALCGLIISGGIYGLMAFEVATSVRGGTAERAMVGIVQDGGQRDGTGTAGPGSGTGATSSGAATSTHDQ